MFHEPETLLNEKDTGYRGIWYAVGELDSEYAWKYSGGLGTYCAKHIPMAVYAPEVDKTFFVYGGTPPTERIVLETIGAYDHKTGMVERPTILMNKNTSDAHDNPVLCIDGSGYLWVFASAHGTSRPAYTFKSRKPYDIEAFDLVETTNYSYPQPFWIAGKGFLLLHTRYGEGARRLFWQTSPDGVSWSEPRKLAHIQCGHYQISWPRRDGLVGTAFNYHPDAFTGDKSKKGLDWRTDMHYVQTDDFGETWRNIQGEAIETPLLEPKNAALVRDFESENLLCYIKDVNYDHAGRPVILYVTAPTWVPGPAERTMSVAHWTGTEWLFHDVTSVDNNYDTGGLSVEPDGTWRIIAPSAPGPQPCNPGGEIEMWTSSDQGVSWKLVKQLTHNSIFNHSYARRPLNASEGFYAYWADGHGRRPSESRLYFSTKSGEVFRLPYTMDEARAKPERVYADAE